MTDKDDPLHKSPQYRKVIVLNGPPGCGKDTAAQFMLHFVRVNAMHMCPMHIKFSEPLKKAAHALFDVFHNWDYYDSKEGAPQKGLSNGDFLGLSPREAYIAVSEQLLKPVAGEAGLGFIMRKRMVRHNQVNCFIVSDSGFIPELEPIISLVGQRNVLVVEIHRAGHTFDGDSRGYIGDKAKEKWPHISMRRLPNTDGDKEMFKMLCEGTAKYFLGIEEKDG